MNTAVRPTDDEWLSVAQVCDIIGFKSVESFYNKRSNGGDLPPMYKLGGKYVRFRKSEVDAWILKQRVVSAAAQIAEAQRTANPRR